MARSLLWVVVILIAASLGADQQAYVERADAEAAARMVAIGDRVRLFCAPCGEETWEEVVVTGLEARHTGYESYWELVVNGSGVDLAYTYVHRGGRWENMAMALSLEVDGVPRFIGGPPPDLDQLRRQARADLVAAEEQLADLVSGLAERSDDEGRRLLLEAQATWLDHRDASARLLAYHAPADLDPGVAYDRALVRLTLDRLGELDRLP